MLDQRQEEFEKEPCLATARRYTTALFDYFADDMIGRDTLRAGLHAIAEGLCEGQTDLGGPVKVIIKAI